MKAIKRDCIIVVGETDLLHELCAALHNQPSLLSTQLQIIYYSLAILTNILELRTWFLYEQNDRLLKWPDIPIELIYW